MAKKFRWLEPFSTNLNTRQKDQPPKRPFLFYSFLITIVTGFVGLHSFNMRRWPLEPSITAHKLSFIILPIFFLLWLPGCSWIISSTTNNFADNLASSILNQSDPATVKDGLPAYLLLIDAMLEGEPNDESLLRTSASLNSSYAGMFSDEPERQKPLSQKALDSASKAVCVHDRKTCHIQTMPFEDFSKIIDNITKEDVPNYYVLGTAWAGWIQAHSDDWNAVAQLPQVERIMHRVVELDEGYESGSAHMYLGVLATLLPPAMGGRPEVGREHFERAIALSEGKNLMSKVVYARHYARLVFDRELHDKLIGEVLATDPEVPGFTLINTIAQQQAKKLSASADDYF